MQQTPAALEQQITLLLHDYRALYGEYLSFIESAIAVADAIDRWRANADPKALPQLDLLRSQFASVFIQHGIRPTAAVGTTFDPRYHEVTDVQTRRDVTTDTIVEVHRMGYESVLLGARRTIQVAKVVVAQKPPSASPENPEDA